MVAVVVLAAQWRDLSCTCLQVKLLLQPLKGGDPSSRQQLCLLDFLSTLKPARQGLVRTLLSKLAEISNPVSAEAMQPSTMGLEASKPPAAEPKAAEPSTGETFTEGMAQLPLTTIVHV